MGEFSIYDAIAIAKANKQGSGGNVDQSGSSAEFLGNLLCEAVLPASSEVGTTIPLGITMADLDEYKALYFAWYGASNTSLGNVYIGTAASASTTAHMLRISYASLAALVTRDFADPNIVTAYFAEGNPSTIGKTPLSSASYFGNGTQAVLLRRNAQFMDWSTIDREEELQIANTYAVPTVDYTLRIYGIHK